VRSPCSPVACQRRRIDGGWTLIEILLVVACIVALVSILLPALGAAKSAARGCVCLSNTRQLVIAWQLYSDDYGSFPVGEDANYFRVVRWGWGGVHWYGDADRTPYLDLPAERPLNAYLAEQPRLADRAEVFRCPADNGVEQASTGVRNWEDFGRGNASGEGDRTTFGQIGTSYEANAWMYCAPGANAGWGRANPRPPLYRDSQEPSHVVVEPSRFIVLGDNGTMAAGHYSREGQLQRNILVGWWHGEDFGQMGFLDGSSRRERVGSVVTHRYSYLMDPDRHAENSWARPFAP
jgi:type II secretory pathway pseudopilin PulG